MRHFISLICMLWVTSVSALDWEEHRLFPGAGTERPLRVLSSTDADLFAPVIGSFQQIFPDVDIEYLVTETAEVERRFRAAPDQYDIVVSSAMDLQVKLANDGFALRLEDIRHHRWAVWRNSLFGFTAEPAAIVLNRQAYAGRDIPETRQELIDLLRADPHKFRGRVATYDVRRSGLGYLVATQDARASETYWRLTEVMGSLDARLYCCSGDMIDDLISGEILVAYNVLGSYVTARQGLEDQIAIVLPADFPTTMMRTAFVSARATQPSVAADFIRHLLRVQSGPQSGNSFLLPSLPESQAGGGQAMISLEPALITYLDHLKRSTFLREWEDAIIQGP